MVSTIPYYAANSHHTADRAYVICPFVLLAAPQSQRDFRCRAPRLQPGADRIGTDSRAWQITTNALLGDLPLPVDQPIHPIAFAPVDVVTDEQLDSISNLD